MVEGKQKHSLETYAQIFLQPIGEPKPYPCEV